MPSSWLQRPIGVISKILTDEQASAASGRRSELVNKHELLFQNLWQTNYEITSSMPVGVGSSPTRGANKKEVVLKDYFFFINTSC